MKLSPRAYTTSGTNAAAAVQEASSPPAGVVAAACARRPLDATYLRFDPLAPTAAPASLAVSVPAPNRLSRLAEGWGAKTYIVRAQMLDRLGLRRLLEALTPQQFVFIRRNVFVPPQLVALHARLAAATPPATPVRFALSALIRGGRLDKLAYLFPYFHLLAGSHTAPLGGSWFSVADARDARAMTRLAGVLQQGPEPICRQSPWQRSLPPSPLLRQLPAARWRKAAEAGVQVLCP